MKWTNLGGGGVTGHYDWPVSKCWALIGGDVWHIPMN